MTMTMTTTIARVDRDGTDAATTVSTGQLVVQFAPDCRCGRPAQPDVDDPERLMSSHRTAAGHVVYFRCACGRARFAHMRWIDC